jgi:sugar transferase (PEP-CTERM/EpsH1 system associated)
MKILFLSRWYPYPPNNGAKLRIYNLLRSLGQDHEVTLLSFNDQPTHLPDISALQPLCQEVQVVPWKPFDPQSQRAWLGFLSLTPRSVVDTYSTVMRMRIEQTLSTAEYDMVIASSMGMAAYGLYFHGLPALLEEVQLGELYEQFAHAPSLWYRFRYGLTWLKLCRYLTTILRNFRVCTVVSNQERQLLSKAIPGYRSVEVIPNCVNLTSYNEVQEIPQPNSLIFTGAFSFYPNYEAMVWFLQEIYPRIQADVPNVRLTITGHHANHPLPPASNVTLTGFVDDVRPFIAGAWASVVPLHIGGGTRLKILEAMALRTPVVATSKGAEGLDVQAGRHLLLADSPESFAQEVIRLLKEPSLRQQLADQAYELVRTKYDWAVTMPRFLELVEQVGCAKS